MVTYPTEVMYKGTRTVQLRFGIYLRDLPQTKKHEDTSKHSEPAPLTSLLSIAITAFQAWSLRRITDRSTHR